MSNDLHDALGRIRERVTKATPAEKISVCRYEHGGGRAYVEGDASGAGRQLVIDAYDEANREFYFRAAELVPALIEACEGLARALEEIAKPDPESAVHSIQEQRLNANRKILARAALSAAAQRLGEGK